MGHESFLLSALYYYPPFSCFSDKFLPPASLEGTEFAKEIPLCPSGSSVVKIGYGSAALRILWLVIVSVLMHKENQDL